MASPVPKNSLHSPLWIGGLLYGITPFAARHQFGSANLSPYRGENYFGVHLLILLALMAVGSSLWGGLATWLRRGAPNTRHAQTWSLAAMAVLMILVVLGFLGMLTGYAYVAAGLATWIGVAIAAITFSRHPTPTYGQFKAILRWLYQKHHWNAVFFVTLYLLLLWHNHQLISWMKHVGSMHKLSIFINRVFTQLSVVGVLYFFIQLSIDTGPRWSRLFIWSCASLAPIAIVVDHFIVGFWNQTLLEFLNNFGVEGILNMEVELKGGGTGLGVAAVVAISLGVFAVAVSLTYLTLRLSRRLDPQIRPVYVLILILLGFGVATLEQSLGQWWKGRRAWMDEYTAFEVHLSPVRPPEGLAFFTVSVREHAWAQDAMDRHRTLDLRRKPDIYIIFVESLRADAVTREITPFLHAFQSREAQPIARGWSCSNGTHLGWYGAFTSRVPLHWATSRETGRQNNWPGLRAFRLLKDAGYRLSVYAPSDLVYRDMGEHFFSTDNRLFVQRLGQDEDGPIPDREVTLLREWKAAVSRRPAGGHLDIIALDSPHYMYHWHRDFDPPFKPYHTGSFFSTNPDEDELQEVKNKYYNSVAWTDTLLAKYCRTLRDLKRYEESIILILGDHGEELHEHGGWLHVSSLEDEQTRIPILIKWPTRSGRGPLLQDASQLDILPGLLDYLTAGHPPADMAGVSLLDGTQRSIIATTAQGGKTREAMILARDGYKAYFTWPTFWNGQPPTEIALTRLTGPHGELMFPTEAEYLAEIRKRFPDALTRFFHTFELKPKPPEE